MESLNKSSQSNTDVTWKVGDKCAAQYTVDDFCYRAVIEEINADQVKVRPAALLLSPILTSFKNCMWTQYVHVVQLCTVSAIRTFVCG